MKINRSGINAAIGAWRMFRPLNESGATAVEFALVLSLFLVIFFGIFEYGWLMTQQILLGHAVSEGARAAVRMPDGASEAELIAAARSAAKDAFRPVGSLTDGDIDVKIKEEEDPSSLGCLVPRRVLVAVPSFSYRPLVGFLPDAAVPDALAADVVFIFP